MTGRSGRGIGLRARQLLTAAREGIRNAEERRDAEERQGAGVELSSASGELPSASGEGRGTTVPAGAAPGAAVPGAAAPGAAAPGAAVNGAAAPGGPYPLDEPAPGSPGASAGIVPRWLQVAGGWAWRLLFIAIALYLAYRVANRLAVVVIPCGAALLLTALLQPVTARLHRSGMPMLAAAWCTLLGTVIVLAGTITLVTIRVQAEYKGLVTQVRHTSRQLETWLAGAPLHLKTGSLQHLSNKLLTYLGQHKSVVAGTVLTGGQIIFEILGGIVLMLFVTFFLLKDGEKIWAWLSRAFGPEGSRRAHRAGRAAWQAVMYYVRGTVLVAAIHAIVIGSALTIMGVPLVAPLAVLVFVAAFIPLVGILFAGALVILITVAAKGWIAALILLGIFVAENQIESHLLQPLVMGRIVRLHPLAIILALAVGGVVGGIPGAVVAVPIAAAITRAAPELLRRHPGAPVPVRGDSGSATPGPR